jgi:ADP-heptose:LPS heptosyltransferase
LQPGKAIEKTIKNSFINFLALLIPNDENAPVPDIKLVNSALVLRPDRLGDFILAVPAINLLKEKLNKKAKLTIVAGSRGEDIASLFFNGDKIIIYKRNFFSFLKMMFYIFINKYDIVINFHSYPFSMTSAIMTLAAKCRVRIGYKETNIKNTLAPKIFNKGVILTNDDLHERDKDMLLLKPLKIRLSGKTAPPKINLPAEAKARAQEFYKNCGIKKADFVIGIHPTLKKKDNRWKKENYRDLILGAREKLKAKTIVVYGMGEEDELRIFMKLIAGIKDVFILPYNDIISIMAAAERFDRFICNDSGIMHAVSMVTDVIAIFGPSTVKRWLPIGANKITILQKKDRNCDSVSTGEVLRKIQG